MKSAETVSRANTIGAIPKLHKAVMPDGTELVADTIITIITAPGMIKLPVYNEIDASIYAKADFDAPEVDLGKTDIESLKWVVKAASKSGVRYWLNGVFFDGENAALVGTDGHRMHIADCQAIKGAHPVVLPIEAVKPLLQLYVDMGKPVSFKMKSKAQDVWFDFGDVKMHVRAIDGRYPDWALLLPNKLNDYTEIDFDILDVAKRSKADARAIIELENAREEHSLAMSGKPGRPRTRTRRLSDGALVIKRDGDVCLENNSPIGRIDGAFDPEFGFLISYLVDASVKGAKSWTDGKKLYSESAGRKSLIMSRRV